MSAAILKWIDRPDEYSIDHEKWISLNRQRFSDLDVIEVIDGLMIYPNIITHLNLSGNLLTDQTGIKLAHYLAASSTIQLLGLHANKFGETTYLALAAALRINTSVQKLFLNNNSEVNKARIDAVFVDALLVNPNRPSGSIWHLYSYEQDDFPRLKAEADRLGHPNMQALLVLADYSL